MFAVHVAAAPLGPVFHVMSLALRVSSPIHRCHINEKTSKERREELRSSGATVPPSVKLSFMSCGSGDRLAAPLSHILKTINPKNP